MTTTLFEMTAFLDPNNSLNFCKFPIQQDSWRGKGQNWEDCSLRTEGNTQILKPNPLKIWEKQDLHDEIISIIKQPHLTGDKQASFGTKALVQVT